MVAGGATDETAAEVRLESLAMSLLAQRVTCDVAKGDLVFIPRGTAHGRSAKGRRFKMLIVSFFSGGPPGGPPGK